MNPNVKYTLLGILTFILLVLLLFWLAVHVTGCGNKQMFDVTYTYKYAYVSWPDGTSEKIAIKSWTDYDGEQLQITTTDNKTYLFSSYNCVLGTD